MSSRTDDQRLMTVRPFSRKMEGMIRRLTAATFLVALLSGCGGGGSSVPQTSPTAAGNANAVISISVPAPASGLPSAKQRSPQYVSMNTQSVSVAVNGGTPVIANVAANSSSCTAASGGGRTCSVTVTAPIGTDTFTEILYASTNGTGTPLSQNQTTATIVAGKSNVVSMTLDGVVASIALALSNATPAQGTAASIPLTVTTEDASGAAIIGNDPFTSAITLTDSDKSGATTLSKTTLSSPADASGLTVAYTGAAIASATFSATATGVSAANVTPATLTPSTATATSFVDWPTYGYDVARSGFNPNSTAITPASISQMHIGWQLALNGSTQSQPIVATNVAGHKALLIVANFAIAQAYDALTGALVWQTTLPTQDVQDCGLAGVSGTAQYDASLGAVFMAAGNGAVPNHVVLYRLNVANGSVTSQVDVTPTLQAGEANKSATGLTLANGRIYVGTGSDCEGTVTGAYPSWRGRVVSVDPNSMTLLSTVFTTWQVPVVSGNSASPGNYGGGGVWAWGGVSSDASGNIYFGGGNGETNASTDPQTAAAPFLTTDDEQIGLAEHLVKMSGDLSTIEGSNYPGFNFAIGGNDEDYTGTPVVFNPGATSGCGPLTATQGKGGTLVINNASDLSEVSSFAFSVPSGAAYYVGNPGFSPTTGYLYAAISSSLNGSLGYPPGLAAIGACGTSVIWKAQFGPDSSLYGENPHPMPRSAPTVTAGGVVFMGTPCTPNGSGGCGAASGTPGGALWAVDATTGTVLNNAEPLIITGDNIRMAPSADGLWLYVLDDSGNFYGLTIDPTVQAVAAKRGRHVARRFILHETH